MSLNYQKTLLLLIDVQNDFCPGGEYAKVTIHKVNSYQNFIAYLAQQGTL